MRFFWLSLHLARLTASVTGIVNIQDFGATPNDGSDDSAAIQSAFNALDPAQGGTVLCPPGVYDVYSPIVVVGSAVRFAGAAGPSYNEDAPYAGCTLVAHTNGMTLLLFGNATLNHRGPVIEYVNLRDATPAGNSAILLNIVNFNRWTVRNVTANYGATGLLITGTDDASWGYVAQFFCKNSNTCIDQSTVEGGFLALGGGLEPLVNGIRIRGPQVRVVGVKFDCVNGSTGIYTTGHADAVSDSTFEECGIGIAVRDDGTQPWNGDQNRFLGNHFIGTEVAGSIGISLGAGSQGNQLIGNTYEYPAVNVQDQGQQNLRLEQGVGASMNLTCPPGQVITSIQTQQGIVTGAACGGTGVRAR